MMEALVVTTTVTSSTEIEMMAVVGIATLDARIVNDMVVATGSPRGQCPSL